MSENLIQEANDWLHTHYARKWSYTRDLMRRLRDEYVFEFIAADRMEQRWEKAQAWAAWFAAERNLYSDGINWGTSCLHCTHSTNLRYDAERDRDEAQTEVERDKLRANRNWLAMDDAWTGLLFKVSDAAGLHDPERDLSEDEVVAAVAELRATIERAVDLIAGGIVDHAVEVTALRIDGAIGTDITEALCGAGWANLDDEARQPLRDLIRRAIEGEP